mgnify:CR=1 FL=1
MLPLSIESDEEVPLIIMTDGDVRPFYSENIREPFTIINDTSSASDLCDLTALAPSDGMSAVPKSLVCGTELTERRLKVQCSRGCPTKLK